MAEGISPAAHLDPDATIGAEVTIGPGAVIAAGAVIGDRVAIGACTVVHPGVRIGPDAVIEECVVLGKRPRLRPGSSAESVKSGDLVLGAGVTVCVGAVLYAGATIGASAIIGDQAQVREGSSVGEHSVVGRASCVDFGAQVGARVSIQTSVYVTGMSIVEDDAFLGPGVMMTNDDAMGRHPRGEGLEGPIVRRAARVGGGVVLVPGVEIGEEAFVGAGAVVTRDVPARSVVVGVPSRPMRDVRDDELIERWRG